MSSEQNAPRKSKKNEKVRDLEVRRERDQVVGGRSEEQAKNNREQAIKGA